MNSYYVAAIWLGMALLASVVSIKIAVPVALVEIAQQLFQPRVVDALEQEARGEKDLAIIRRQNASPHHRSD